MKHYIYKTTNLVNGRYYIGKHSSDSIQNDRYLGSGKVITLAIQKYGRQNFKRQILYQFNEQSQAYSKQKQLLSKQTLLDPLCYNISKGGKGSWSHRKGKTQIRCVDGRIRSISCSKYNKLIHTHLNYGMAVMVDKTTGMIRSVSSSERNLSPQRYQSINKNYAIYRNINTGCNERLDVTAYIDNAKYQHVNSGFVIVQIGSKLQRISVHDERYVSGQLRSKDADKIHCYDKNGNYAILETNSSQWKSGEFIGVNKNKIWCHDPATFKCRMVRNIEDVPLGYSLGVGKQRNNSHRGHKFMNKDGIRKSVAPEDIQKYIQDGWKFGLKEVTESHR